MINHIQWFVDQLSYKPYTLNKFRFVNARSAKHTINLLKELGITPCCLFDVGANQSQWAYWIVKEWPDIVVHSFEPNIKMKPLGMHHRIALSNTNGFGKFIIQCTGDTCSELSDKGKEVVQIKRLDSIFGDIPPYTLLKVDAENHTAKALEGMGRLLGKFRAVVVEVQLDQELRIHELMAHAGFNCHRPIDMAVANGRMDWYELCFWNNMK